MTRPLLEEILSPNSLSIVVQPIVRVSRQRRALYGIECLTRGPKGTLFERPDVLFDYVRRKKAELAVDWKVIDLALRTCALLPAPIRISINVHASSLGRDPAFAESLPQRTQEAGIDITRLTVEIVEHAPMWNKPQFRRNIAALQKFGVMIALDDIGAGQANYHMILDAAPDCFKVDSFIVAGICSDPRRRAIVSSIIKLASELGSSLVVEGVEDETTLTVLADLGVELMQGYLFSRPTTVDQLLSSEWFSSASRGVGASA